MKSRFKSEYLLNKNYFFFGIAIAFMTIVPQLYFSPNETHTWYLVLTLLLMISITKFSKILFAVFVIFINMSNVLIGHIAMHWGYVLPDIRPRIEMAFLSPKYELLEYFNVYVDHRDYALGFYTLVVLYMLFCFIRHYAHSYKVFRVIGLGVFASIIVSVTLSINPLRELEPFSVPCEVCSVIDDKKHIEHVLSERAKFIRYVKIDKANQKHQLYDKIVIVMGESANKRHMSLYGYAIPTTPFLDTLKKSKEFYVFNAISPTNQTRFSIPIDLTEANVHHFEDRFLHSCSVLTHFRSNNYQTYWISNQGRAGKHDSTIASIAYEANTTFFANLNYLDAKTDDVLLRYLDSMKPVQKKEMYLLHLMGSHADYINRYDPKTALFKNSHNMVEQYDNSIRYTDFILSQIVKRFKHEKLLLIYVSDHGENIAVDNNGHGFTPSYKDEYSVPFVVYSNVKNPRLDELYSDNQQKLFNLENLNFMILYLSGLSNHKNISYSKDVISVVPSTVVDFDTLEFYN